MDEDNHDNCNEQIENLKAEIDELDKAIVKLRYHIAEINEQALHIYNFIDTNL